jgi:hypothetical protein
MKTLVQYFINALKLMPYYKGIVYRGIKDYRDKNAYSVGKSITWRTISSLSKNLAIA